MKIGTRCAVVGLAGVAGVVALGVAGHLAVRAGAGKAQHAVDVGAAHAHLLRADAMHDALRADALEAVFAPEADRRRQAEAAVRGHADLLLESLEAAEAGLDGDAGRAVSDARPVNEELARAAQRLAEAGPEGDAGLRAAFDEAYAQSTHKNERAIESAGEAAGATAALARARAASATWTLLGLSAGATVVLLGLGWSLRRAVAGGLRDVSAGMQRLAAGDLTKDFDASRADELGDLARAGNAMLRELRSVFGSFGQVSREVAAAATQLSASAEEIARGIREQSTQAERVRASVSEVAGNIAEVADTGAKAKAEAERSGEQAAEGGELVEKTVSQVNEVAGEVGSSAEAITALGKKSEEIGQIIGVINDIADQTNLLALNAAIEAARAGEHGRGFAVVADEVRKLAERTANATQEVGRAIGQVQAGTNDAVQRMNASRERVEQSVGVARNSGSAMRAIVETQRSLQGLVQSIADSVERQRSAADEIERSVTAITTSARASSQGADQSAQAAVALSRQAETLRAQASKFKF